MLDQLRQVFSRNRPLHSAGEQYAEMQTTVRDMIATAHSSYWGGVLTDEERRQLHEIDSHVNLLQRRIRREIVMHLSGPGTSDIPYGLLLMSLVKDTERLGDYAKNLAEVHEVTGIGAGDLPLGELTNKLMRTAQTVQSLSQEAVRVYSSANEARATELVSEGRATAQNCDSLLRSVARAPLGPAVAVNMTLAIRYYKRISAHQLNILSSVLLPLHELDYSRSHEDEDNQQR